MENEKRMRREIANSNERRRMQSINAGFQSLRSLLPHHEGEKLSKVCKACNLLNSVFLYNFFFRVLCCWSSFSCCLLHIIQVVDVVDITGGSAIVIHLTEGYITMILFVVLFFSITFS